jgi:hypothetical protein
MAASLRRVSTKEHPDFSNAGRFWQMFGAGVFYTRRHSALIRQRADEKIHRPLGPGQPAHPESGG